MDTTQVDALRRALLKSAAAGVVAGLVGVDVEAAAVAAPAGKPGEFDFLSGEWKIRHRRLKQAGTQDWDEFSGEASCWSILGGRASIEELRIPARDFSGLGLRLFDAQNQVWSDFWVNAKSGVLAAPGTTGRFIGGVGTFEADDQEDGKPIKVRGVWDRITPQSCRWHQAVSRDGGAHWEGQWYMDWTRAGGS